jgi:hypothetical protein
MKHPGVQHGVFITFGADGFFLISPLKLDKDEWKKYGFDESGKGERFIYRIGFMVPPEEEEMLQSVMASSATAPSDGSSAGHLNREDYVSSSEAISYIQSKINRGVRYTPADLRSSKSPEGLRIRNQRYKTAGLDASAGGAEMEDFPINPSMGNIPQVEKVVWASTFRIRQAIAGSFYKPVGDNNGETEKGHILLVGDAAHVHSPAGGQGMNLGIRDGVECGKAIADHLKLSSSAISSSPSTARDPLEAYALARRAEALDIIAVTHRMSKMMVMDAGSLSASVRDWVLWCGGRCEFAKKKLVWKLSGLGTRREGEE